MMYTSDVTATKMAIISDMWLILHVCAMSGSYEQIRDRKQHLQASQTEKHDPARAGGADPVARRYGQPVDDWPEAAVGLCAAADQQDPGRYDGGADGGNRGIMSTLKKLRMNGETIDPKKSYSGAKVVELLNESYNNGYNRAKRELAKELEDSYKRGYLNGYDDGYDKASDDLAQLKKLLSNLLDLDTVIKTEA